MYPSVSRCSFFLLLQRSVHPIRQDDEMSVQKTHISNRNSVSGTIVFWFTKYFSCLLTLEPGVDLIITRFVPKSLCFGWSCETGPSYNITTVMIFSKWDSNSHFAASGLSGLYYLYSLCRNINNYTTKLHVLCLSPPPILFFQLF